MRKILLIPLMLISLFVKAQTPVNVSQAQKFLKYIIVNGKIVTDSAMAGSDSSTRVPNTKWTKQNFATARSKYFDNWGQILYEGDSITDTVGGFSFNWPRQLFNTDPSIARKAQVNVAQAGDQIQSIIGEYTTQVHPYRPLYTNQTYYFALMAGTNDAKVGRTSTQIYNDLKTEWAYARADGFKVIAMCITRSTDPARDTAAVAANVLIKSNASLYDYLVRTDEILPNPSNLTYYQADGVHLTAAGSLLLANEVTRVLRLYPLRFDSADLSVIAPTNLRVMNDASVTRDVAIGRNLTAGTGAFTTAGKDALIISDASNQAAGTGGSILFKGVYTNGGTPLPFGRIGLEKVNSTSGNFLYNISFYTSNNATNPNSVAALIVGGDNSAIFSGPITNTGADNYTVDPTYSALTKISQGYAEGRYARIASPTFTGTVSSPITRLTNVSGVSGGTDSLLSKNATTNIITKIPASYYLTPAGSGASLSNVVNSITGTSNQVIASASTGVVTLSLPQSIATTSSPTFAAGTTISGSGDVNFNINSTVNASYAVWQKGGVDKFYWLLERNTPAYGMTANDIGLIRAGQSTPDFYVKQTNGDAIFNHNLSAANLNPTATQTAITGGAVGTMPFQGSSYKKVVINISGFSGTGSVYTFPTAFTNTPLYAVQSTGGGGLSVITPTTTNVTFTGSATTGWLILEGY